MFIPEITKLGNQGNDNTTYRLGNLTIRVPNKDTYALHLPIEFKFLSQAYKYISIKIPKPIYLEKSFAIYEWIDGEVLNNNCDKNQLAYDLRKFLYELQNINEIEEVLPGQHNYFRGNHINVYNESFYKHIIKCNINIEKAIDLWENARKTQWNKHSVWIHGDLAKNNILIKDNKLEAVIDFGGLAFGDPACDYVIAWKYFSGESRDIFLTDLDSDLILRAKAWCLWKAAVEKDEILIDSLL